MINKFYNLAILVVIAYLAACAAPGSGSGAGTIPQFSLFSHNSYTFAAAAEGNEIIVGLREIGRVIPDLNRIQAQLARFISSDNSQEDISTSDYEISYSLATAEGMSVFRFFSIDATTGILSFNNTRGLSVDEVIDILPNGELQVRMRVTTSASSMLFSDNPRTIESLINVRILNSSAAIAFDDSTNTPFSYDIALITNSTATTHFLLESGDFEDGNPIGANIDILVPQDDSTSASLVDIFGLRSATDSPVTLFYDVRDLDDASALCGGGGLYIDNSDMMLKAATSFRFEQVQQYSCRLATSNNGLDYRFVQFLINSTMDVAEGAVNASSAAPADVAQSALRGEETNTTCTATRSCYYGDLVVDIIINRRFDADADRIRDSVDNCPALSNPSQTDSDGDGMGDPCDGDLDGDGVANGRDNCPMMPNPDQTNICDPNGDPDNDNIPNSMDIDDDGDNLIEISTAAQLNAIRNNLNGTGLDLTGNDDDLYRGGDATGCGGLIEDLTDCRGYELTNNIDLNALTPLAIGANWQPIGFCSDPTCSSPTNFSASNINQVFLGSFEGNGFSIRNMRIHLTEDTNGVGFFAAMSNGSISNLRIDRGSISHGPDVRLRGVGGLIGIAENQVRLNNVQVAMDSIAGDAWVGGLVGRAYDAFGSGILVDPVTGNFIIDSEARIDVEDSTVMLNSLTGMSDLGGIAGLAAGTIVSSSVEIDNLEGRFSNVGGLVGNGYGLTAIPGLVDPEIFFRALIDPSFGASSVAVNLVINSSSADIDTMLGFDNVGGLAGSLLGSVHNSHARLDTIEGRGNLGGLAGTSVGDIDRSTAMLDSIIARGENSGGLVGSAGGEINGSSATLDNIRAREIAGGLVGVGVSGLSISGSQARLDSITGTFGDLGGLVGAGFNMSIASSSVQVMGDIQGTNDIGGLVGNAAFSKISDSSAQTANIRGVNRLGGLVGSALSTEFNQTSASLTTIDGNNDLGGLVGNAIGARIADSSAVLTGEISGAANIGGLLGDGRAARVRGSLALVPSLAATGSNAGGLLGNGAESDISGTLAVARQITSFDNLGGLVGDGFAAQVNTSYVLSGRLSASSNLSSHHLVGGTVPADIDLAMADGSLVEVTDSYWQTGVVIGQASLLDQAALNITQRGSQQSPTRLLSGMNNNIYANWTGAVCADETTMLWDFGENTQYPVIGCFGDRLPVAMQRATISSMVSSFAAFNAFDTGLAAIGIRGIQIVPQETTISLSWNNTILPDVARIDEYVVTVSEYESANLDSFTRTIGSLPSDFSGIGEEQNIEAQSLSSGFYYRIQVDAVADGGGIIARSGAADRELNDFILTGVNTDNQGQIDLLDLDDDGDGWTDEADNCPLIANTPQRDTDNDGIGDYCDDDIDGDGIANQDDPDTDGDGLLNKDDPDADGDLVLNPEDNCPLTFNPAQTNSMPSGDQRNGGRGDACADSDTMEADDDGDGIPNLLDIDADGDGLIEISTAAELNALRNDPLAYSFAPNNDGSAASLPRRLIDVTLGNGMRIEATIPPVRLEPSFVVPRPVSETRRYLENRQGCSYFIFTPSSFSDNSLIYSYGGGNVRCRGYELTNDIDLADIANWTPISLSESANIPLISAINLNSQICSAFGTTEPRYICAGSKDPSFSRIFEGNGHSILNMRINIDDDTENIGLFSSLAPSALVRNLNIANAEISVAPGSSVDNLGVLAGSGDGARVINATALNSQIRGRISNLGGLIGRAESMTVQQSFTFNEMIAGSNNIGGLLGTAVQSTIENSAASSQTISGADNIGGLVGMAGDTVVENSAASSQTISGGRNIGGLLGDATNVTLSDADSRAADISGINNIGGLVGSYDGELQFTDTNPALGLSQINIQIDFLRGQITDSSSFARSIRGVFNIGGLIGNSVRTSVYSSSAVADSIAGRTNVGGLLGDGREARVDAALAIVNNITGDDRVGGLLGDGSSIIRTNNASVRLSTISNSYAVAGDILGNTAVGGLLGRGSAAVVNNSYARSNSIEAREVTSFGFNPNLMPDSMDDMNLGTSVTFRGHVHPLIAGLISPNSVVSSYWQNDLTLLGNTTLLERTDRGTAQPASNLRDSQAEIFTPWRGARCADQPLWDFGDNQQYPLNNCLGNRMSIADQASLIAAVAAGTAVSSADIMSSFVDAPTGLAITRQPLSRILDISWNRVPNALYYQLERTLGGQGGQSGQVEILTTPSFTSGRLSNSYTDEVGTANSYSYRVRACDIMDVCSGFSDAVAGSIPQSLPVPGNFQAEGISSSVVRLSWSAVRAASHYEIRRSNDFGSDFVPPSEIITPIAGTDTDYLDPVGSNGMSQFAYEIRTCSASLPCSVWSDPISLPDSDGDFVPDALDNCPTTANPRQENADGVSDGGNACDEDDDNDNLVDALDVDQDGDGLIELRTALELNAMRNNLNATAFDINDENGDSLGGGVDLGCGGGTDALGTRITECFGYEIMNDIDLNDLQSNPTMPNWERIGFCRSNDCFLREIEGAPRYFTGVFDGNGYAIRNMRILIDNDSPDNHGVLYAGVGFFGAIGNFAEIRNVHLVNSRITLNAQNIYVGGLVGIAEDSQIVNAHVDSIEIDGSQAANTPGGLVGLANDSDLGLSSVSAFRLGGIGNVGGLIGLAVNSDVSASYTALNLLSSDDVVGGLVGFLQSTNIRDSYAVIDRIQGGDDLGGLAGFSAIFAGETNVYPAGTTPIISNSYAISSIIAPVTTSSHQLQGGPSAAQITNSYWQSGIENGNSVPFVTPVTGRGTGQSRAALQTPTTAQGIYSQWTATCDNERQSLWNFGTSGDYPVIACRGTRSPIQQRAAIIFALVDPDRDGVLSADDNCPTNANPSQRNSDGDDFGDACDVDADGDGLIEISTAPQLDAIRNNLAGTGLDRNNADGDAAAGGDTAGCGGAAGITACDGYELTAHIDLNDLVLSPGPNWQRIGACSADCNSRTAFNAEFDGNDYEIRNMHIHNSVDSDGVGLFGAISSTALIRNTHLVDAVISHDPGVTVGYLGLLAGFADGADIMGSSAHSRSLLSGDSRIGGLLGRAQSAMVVGSSASFTSIAGVGNSVGGLIGDAASASITNSFAIGRSINTSGAALGGLVGSSADTTANSAAIVSSISGNDAVGGLAGRNTIGTEEFFNSYAVVGNISGNDRVGGLVGESLTATTENSYAVPLNIIGSTNRHQLLAGTTTTATENSYWQSGVQDGAGMPFIADLSTGPRGSDQSTTALQTPTSAAGIYEQWTDTCEAEGEAIWDFGGASDYPVISCFGTRFTAAEQRSAIAMVLNIGMNTGGDIDGDGIANSEDACSIAAVTGWTSTPQTDLDRDGCRDLDEDLDDDNDNVPDVLDIDDDADGLIEIGSVADLNMMRFNLQGTSLRRSAADSGNALGCGGLGTQAACVGYELTNSIALPAGRGSWQPIGSCVSFDDCPAEMAFRSVFEGNNHNISNVNIYISADAAGVGFFGSISSTLDDVTRIRNLNLIGLNIAAAPGVRIDNVGGLVGHNDFVDPVGNTASAEANQFRTAFDNILIQGDSIAGNNSIGGLLGNSLTAIITNSAVELNSIRATGQHLGGMAGSFFGLEGEALIQQSSARVAKIEGTANVGGLVGRAGRGVNSVQTSIISSLAILDSIAGTTRVGGLVGSSGNYTISSSMAIADSISGTDNIGGLIGFSTSLNTASFRDHFASYALARSISGMTNVSGFLGNTPQTGGGGFAIEDSWSLGTSISGTSGIHPLIGDIGFSPSIANSFWHDRIRDGNGNVLSIDSIARGSAQSASSLQGLAPLAGGGMITSLWADNWCDPTDGSFTNIDDNMPLTTDANRAWDFGSGSTINRYPVLSCFGDSISAEQQRQAIRELLNGNNPAQFLLRQ